MPYLIQPPFSWVHTCNPIYQYCIAEPDDNEKATIRDLRAWGWKVTRHSDDDSEYLDAMKKIERVVKGRRRRTQMVYGNIVGEGSRPTLEEMWEIKAVKKLNGRLFEVEEEEEEEEEEADTSGQLARPETERHAVRELEGNEGVDVCHEVGIEHLSEMAEIIDIEWRSKWRQDPRVTWLEPHTEHEIEDEPQPVGRYIKEKNSHINPRVLTGPYMMIRCEVPATYRRARSVLKNHMRRHSTTKQSAPPSSNEHVWKAGPLPEKPKQTSHPLIPNYYDHSSDGTPGSVVNHHKSKERTTKNYRRVSLDAKGSVQSSANTRYGSVPLPLTYDTAPDLIFPGEKVSEEEYFRHTTPSHHATMPPCRHHTAPGLQRPGLSDDPYGWLEWDKQKQLEKARTGRQREMAEDIETSLGCCMLRQRQSLRDTVRKEIKEGELGKLRGVQRENQRERKRRNGGR